MNVIETWSLSEKLVITKKLPLQKTLVYENGSWLKPRFTLLGPLKKNIRLEEDKTARGFADKRTGKRFQIRTFFQTTLNNKQETLCVVTIAMICSTLASLWKSQYFQRPIYNPVEDLWWSLYCENIKPLSIFTKKLDLRYSHGF